LQARLATRLAAGLGEELDSLPHDICERLRIAREQAVSRARELRSPQRAGAVAPGVVAVGAGMAVLGGPSLWWRRLAAVLPLLVLLGGLVLISDRTTHEQVRAAADIDSVLLADDLPPAAYSDPGFAEYLKTPP
jgi:hypothetical protein